MRKYFRVDTDNKYEVYKYLKHPKVRKFLNERRPKISELPDNQGYVTFPNGEVKLQRFEMPSFHHKTSLEDFTLDTGIKWKVIHEKKPTKEKPESKIRQSQRDEILKKIDYMITNEKKSFKQVREELIIMENEGNIPDFGFSDKDSKYFNNWYLKWKKKQKDLT